MLVVIRLLLHILFGGIDMNKKIHDIVNVISAIFITAILIFIFFNTDLLGKVFVSFFLAIALVADVWVVFSILGKNEFLPMINIIMLLIFLVYWFAFLAFGSYWAIIHESYSLFIVIVPFAIIGFMLGYSKIVKKK